MTSADSKAISKRQRRAQGSNPSTTWQQQPRIKSAASRAKAYINYAGLNDDGEDNDGKRTSDKKKGSTTKKVQDMLDPELDLNSPEVKFGRMLGGTEQRVRHKAVKMLRHYLKQRVDIASGAGISELDLMKLWKAMWYTLYMADKVPVQDKLSQILAELMWCLAGTEEDDEYAGQVYMQITEEGNGVYEDEDGDVMWTEVVEDDEDEEEDDDEEDNDENAWQDMPSDDDDDEEGNEVDGMDESEDDEEIDEEEARIAIMNESHCRGAHLVSLYVATFLRTVKREWGNVDKHRVDKFYTAVRLMIRESYKYMAVRHWNLGIIRLFNDVIYDEALSHESEGLTNGLRFHLIDICIEELAQVNANAEIPLTEATFLDCVEPFFALAQKAQDKNVHKRVMEKVLLKFLTEYSFVAKLSDQEEEDGGEDAPLTFSQVHVGSVAKFIFEIASDPESDERFRKALYEMYKTYERQIRAAGRDVDLSHIEEGDSEEDCCANNTCGVNKACPMEEEGAAEEDNETSQMEEDDAEPETPVETKSDKKKKKKKSKKKSKELVEAETLLEEDKNAEVSTPKAKASSKKKKKKGNDDKENVTSEDLTAQYDGSATKKSSKKRRDNDETTPPSKKKQRSSSPSVDPHSMPSPDFSPTSSDADDAAAGGSGGSRRVSFGKMNHCKSYKASIKAIKTLKKERWDTTTRTPEKGILNKTPLKSKSSAKASSKKASSKKRKSKK
mmetsp:Transcript_31995/g.47106  ORF Transcript_31995/g.47106 Transcript_31995/m.47106 type:complete len:726 (-) Transcript_31995:45-2222(-)